MPLQATSGAASQDGFGGNGVPIIPNYIEEVFSTYLYTGTGATQSITNGIDLSTKGGLVWIKSRSAATNHNLFDTAQGTTKSLHSNTTDATTTDANSLTAFNTTGFTLGSGNTAGNQVNTSAATYVSWTLRKQPKFFDIVTYTGNGVAGRQISHNLGSTPGFMVVKRTNASGNNWIAWHRSLSGSYIVLNSTAAAAASQQFVFGNDVIAIDPTSTVFTVASDGSVNLNGSTYVAYFFAHNAGGFGLTGTDNVISCGSYTGNGSATGPTVTIAYEPQWLLIKRATGGTAEWTLIDNMRGIATGGTDALLSPNFTDAEYQQQVVDLTSTGFVPMGNQSNTNANASTYIYIAIRRGPMKVPTVGTSVFGLNSRSGTGANATVTGGQTDDAVIIKNTGAAVGNLFAPRLIGTGYLETSSTAAEVAAGVTILQANPWDVMDGVKVGTTSTITNASANTFINYLFKRAPSFFDVVCYTGTGVATTQTHNLAAVPELMMVKARSSPQSWKVYASPIGNTKVLDLSTDNAESVYPSWNNTTPTSTVFSLGGSGYQVNNSGVTYVAYLFATCAGVSKVGSYTGTAALQTVNCGFTSGARFIVIKRTDSTGDWYLYDSVRGISATSDPYLLLNTTSGSQGGTNYVDTDTTGFKVTAAAPAGLNASGGTYIFLAIS